MAGKFWWLSSVMLALGVAMPGRAAVALAPAEHSVITPLMEGDEPIVVTRHVIRTPKGPLVYEARVGRLPIRVDETGEVHAHIFFVAYVVTNRGHDRAVTIAWNGGPTVPSSYVHTELLGPRRLVKGAFQDNPATLLAASDLVFMDPVETGFSRPARPEFAPEFLNMMGDVAATSEFIRAYRTRFGVEDNPLFVLGESYGGWRAAAVADMLTGQGVKLSGLIIVSGGFAGVPIPSTLNDANLIQTRTATAFHFEKLPPALMRDRDATLKMVDRWANTTYLQALDHPDRLSSAERAGVISDLARFTGVKPDQIDPKTMEMSTNAFLAHLVGGVTLSDEDSRIVGSLRPAPDRALAISRYLRGELQYSTDMTYAGDPYARTDMAYRSIEAGYVPVPGPAHRSTGAQWHYNQSPNADAALQKVIAEGDVKYLENENPPWVTNAMTRDTSLRVFTAMGRFDPTNMCEGQVARTATLSPQLAGRVDNHCYEGGHLMYRDEDAILRLSGDLVHFVQAAARP
jgi:hypothetical protein